MIFGILTFPLYHNSGLLSLYIGIYLDICLFSEPVDNFFRRFGSLFENGESQDMGISFKQVESVFQNKCSAPDIALKPDSRCL